MTMHTFNTIIIHVIRSKQEKNWTTTKKNQKIKEYNAIVTEKKHHNINYYYVEYKNHQQHLFWENFICELIKMWNTIRDYTRWDQ